METWNQVYDPFGNAWLSTLAASLPVIALLGMIASGKVKAHIAAVLSLVLAFVVAVFVFGMPAGLATRASLLGMVTGFFPIGWIILNVIFLYRLTVEKGWFATLQQSVAGITQDRRLQLLLVAFAFGAFFEGAGGFGTPVAVTGAILIGLGFSPLAASGLSLIANTAPVAYGALGAPISGPRLGHRLRSLHPRRHDRPAAALLLAPRAVLADLGLRGLPRHDPESGSRSWSAAPPSRSRSSWSRTTSVPGSSTSAPRSSRWAPGPVPEGLAAAEIWTSPALRGHDPSHRLRQPGAAARRSAPASPATPRRRSAGGRRPRRARS